MEKDQILYNETDHTYFVNGKQFVSVTELAQTLTDYDTTWLKAHPEYAERGTKIHNELAEFFAPNSDMNSDDLSEDAGFLARRIDRSPMIQTEVLVYNKKHEYAGTVDLVKIDKETKKCLAIVDWKTGDHVNKLYCRCQLSLYYLAMKEMGFDMSETKLYVITPLNNTLVEPFSWTEMTGLRADYEPSQDESDLIELLEQELAELEPSVEQYNEIQQRLKSVLNHGFERTNTRRFTGKNYLFTYVPGSTRKSLDKDKVQEQLGNLDDYMKESTVSPSIRIKQI